MKKLICRIVKYLIDILNEVYTWCHTTIAAPTLLTATVVPPDVELEWVDNADNNTCFNVWRSTDGTNFTLIDTIGDLENYTDSTATPGVRYWYKVQACDGSGNTSDFSNTVDTGVLFTEIDNGILYNWFAVNGLLAPAGWHIPTKDDYWTLLSTLDPVGTEWANTAGGQMKDTSAVYWMAPNTGATNSSGFTGRGAGYRQDNGVFSGILLSHRLWNSNQLDATNALVSNLSNSTASFTTSNIAFLHQDKNFGLSVRMIKDDSTDPGLLTDYDGNIYQTVKIGTQVWTKYNFICKHYTDGTPIPEETVNATWAGLATGAWCYYDNDPNNM